MSVILLDDDRQVVSMSPAALRLYDLSLDQAAGKTLSELASRDVMLAVLPPDWRRTLLVRKDPVGDLLEEVARVVGNATAWIWLLTPKSRLFRCILNTVKVENGFIVYVGNVEDPFNRTMVRAEQDGTIVGSRGARWTLQTIQLFEDYISGVPLHRIALDHDLSISRVRTTLDAIADDAGFASLGALRASVYNSYAEEMIPSRHAIFPVVSDELPGFPQHDLPVL
jgi:hypothetical protein